MSIDRLEFNYTLIAFIQEDALFVFKLTISYTYYTLSNIMVQGIHIFFYKGITAATMYFTKAIIMWANINVVSHLNGNAITTVTHYYKTYRVHMVKTSPHRCSDKGLS